uniref:Uncharacterized protein n=1 Tax=viral metagenome TaxID=1070528 RepID=A0A6H1ZMI0_9ZZZZ
MTHQITGSQLQEYLDGFSQGFQHTVRPMIREAVLKQITDSEFLRSAFSTPEGVALFNHGLERIAVEVGKIIEKSIAGVTAKTAEKIVPHAQHIKIIYDMMESWAKTYDSGQKHIQNAKKKEK